MFAWTINEARRDKIAREVQKAILKVGGRRLPNGETLLYMPKVVEALLGRVASVLDSAPQCATPGRNGRDRCDRRGRFGAAAA